MSKKRKSKVGIVEIMIRAYLYIILSAAIVAAVFGLFYLLLSQNSKITSLLSESGALLLIFIISVVLVNAIVVISLIISGKTQKAGAAEDDGAAQRFGSLAEIDGKMASYTPPEFNSEITLSELCEGFRNFAASKFGLYYDMLTVRSFVASLPVSKLLIMQGISGTGKTSMAWAFGEYIGKKASVIPVQPSWKEKTDLLGYFNEFTSKYNETEFLRSIYDALYNDNVNVLVLDEMNIARVEYYFAEFLSLLEIKQAESRYIDLTSSGWSNDPKFIENGRIRIPENIWYVGTANNDDSTMAISDKVYDRAMVLDLDRRAEPFDAPETEGVTVSYSHLIELGRDAVKSYVMSDKARAGIDELDRFLIDNLEISFGNRIVRQLEEFIPIYISCGGTENEAIDIIVSRKVLRKLEAKNPMHVKRVIPGFMSFLDTVFGENEMNLSRKTISKYNI